MKVKICGIKNKNDINLMNTYQPNFIGFIFYKKSKRYIDFEKAKILRSYLNKSIKVVGVFVNENTDKIVQGFKQGIFDIAQLHGDESTNEIEYLKSQGIPVIKAIKVNSINDIGLTEKLNPDWFLFDIKDKKLVGGTGRSFDWNYLKNYSREIPYFLAGGINSNNIKNTFKTNADVLDISSGVEVDGKKDALKVKEIFEIFRKIN